MKGLLGEMKNIDLPTIDPEKFTVTKTGQIVKKHKYTVKDFIERLKALPQDQEVKGYIFQLDDGNCRLTFEMGEIKKK